jgi:hypothetical protein
MSSPENKNISNASKSYSSLLLNSNNKNNKTGGGNFVDQGDIDRYPERFSKLHQDYNLDDFKGNITDIDNLLFILFFCF